MSENQGTAVVFLVLVPDLGGSEPCSLTSLTPSTVPKYVFWVNDFPKTASGKIQKYKLREDGVRLVSEGKGLE